MKIRHLILLSAALAGASPFLPPLAQSIHAAGDAETIGTPDSIVEKIASLLDGDDGSDDGDPKVVAAGWKQKLVTLDGLIADFRKHYAGHSLRWDVLFFEANSFEIRATLHLELPKTARPSSEIFAEILAAPDASEDIKAQSSAARLGHMADAVHDKKLALGVWEKLFAEHLAAFPEMEDNAMLSDARIELVSELDAPRLGAVLEELAKSPTSEIAEIAKARIIHEKMLTDLKSNPFELAFKALDGTDVDIAKWRGKVVLIHFWANWNSPSTTQIPALLKTYTTLHEKGLEIVGISLDEENDTLKQTLQTKKMAWPQYFDGKGWESPLARKYDVEVIPTIWLLNKKGMVVDTDAGEGYEAKIERLLAEE